MWCDVMYVMFVYLFSEYVTSLQHFRLMQLDLKTNKETVLFK